MQLTTIAPAELVAEAAEYMDALFPGWRSRVNPARLYMDDPGLCVLGQATGRFGPSFCKMALVFSEGRSQGDWSLAFGSDLTGEFEPEWRKVIAEVPQNGE